MSDIHVGSEYVVTVEGGAMSMLAAALPETAEQVLLVHSAAMPELAERAAKLIAATGARVHLAPVPDSEAAKTGEVAAALWRQLGEAAFTRSDVVVAVGGGTVTDLGGFVAATWLRGVPVVQVPTTLLAMVDAAVGGKTGINTAEGKNLVGAFHEPLAVICDLDVLATLPRPDLAAGLAEVVKAGFIADPVILDLVEAGPQEALSPDSPVLAELVDRAIRVKADVVAVDLTESYLREILNYGHTFGHAVEQVEQYGRRHGEAVAIGMVFAAELSCLAGRLSADLVARHREILQSIGLPITFGGSQEVWARLHTAMTRDKKSRGSLLRFIVLDGVARPGRLEGPSPHLLRTAFDRLAP